MDVADDIRDRVRAILDPRLELLRIQGSQVILSVNEKMPTPERGKLLLDTERYLRREVKRNLEVLLEPKGDLSKLRQRLRGVTLDGTRDAVFDQRYQEGENQEKGGTDQNEAN